MSTLIPAGTAVAAALAFGISSVADQRSTKRVKTRRALSPGILADLVRQPLWLTAVGANIIGFVLQVAALSFGSLALVQPLLVGDLVFAVLIFRYLGRRAHMPLFSGRTMFAGVAATTAGIAGFLAIGRPSSGHANVSFGVLVPLAIGLVVVVGACLAVSARNRSLRPLALGLACGVNYGVAAFVVKLVTSEAGGGLATLLGNWPIYVLAVVGPAGFLLNQNAFQQGTSLAPVQAIITTADPVISIGLGVLWLNVRLSGGPAAIFGEVASLLLMAAGIIIITGHRSPQVAGGAVAERPRREPGPPVSDAAY